jgi:Abortive infection C-terminus
MVMTVEQSSTFEAAVELKHFMIARATDGGKVDPRSFRRAREAIMRDRTGSRLGPECLRICREPDAVWSYVKSQDPALPSYESRRQFFNGQFEPLLSALERFEASPLDDLVEPTVERLDSAGVTAAWEKARDRRARDPDGAITAARTLLESVCKTILDDYGEPTDGHDLPALYRRTCAVLTLAPRQYTDEQLRRILGGCTTVVEGLGSLRNREGDSHGQGRRSYRPAARHATLAVNLAGSMALFLIETHEARETDDE